VPYEVEEGKHGANEMEAQRIHFSANAPSSENKAGSKVNFKANHKFNMKIELTLL
jgi:hypothetical protein